MPPHAQDRVRSVDRPMQAHPTPSTGGRFSNLHLPHIPFPHFGESPEPPQRHQLSPLPDLLDVILRSLGVLNGLYCIAVSIFAFPGMLILATHAMALDQAEASMGIVFGVLQLASSVWQLVAVATCGKRWWTSFWCALMDLAATGMSLALLASVIVKNRHDEYLRPERWLFWIGIPCILGFVLSLLGTIVNGLQIALRYFPRTRAWEGQEVAPPMVQLAENVRGSSPPRDVERGGQSHASRRSLGWW